MERQGEDDGGIGEWMARRWADIQRLGDEAEAAGRHAWAAATRRGEPLQAATPHDVRALGAQATQQAAATPIRRGPNARLSDEDIAGIIFNETRALSGDGIDQARVNLAHAVINGDEMYDDQHRPRTAPTRVRAPDVERSTYDAALAAVRSAREQRAQGIDPTNGGTHFNFRPNDSTTPFKPEGSRPSFEGYPIRTHAGPFRNSYPNPKMPPRDGVYSNVYDDD